MDKNLYVGHMSCDMTQERLQALFQAHGKVTSVAMITNRNTALPTGFANVEMATEQAAGAAIAALHGQEVDGRALTVNKAKPCAPRGGGRDRGNRSRRW